MEKSLDTTRTTTPTAEFDALALWNNDPRLKAADAQFDAPLSMTDIENRNEVLAERRRLRQPSDLKLSPDDYRKAIEVAFPVNPIRGAGSAEALGKTVLTYRDVIGY